MPRIVLCGEKGGKKLVANVITPLGICRQENVVCCERSPGGVYVGDCPTVQFGDTILFYKKHLLSKDELISIKMYEEIPKGSHLTRG